MSRAAASGSGVPFGPLRVDVDQAHLHGAERLGQLPLTAVALVAEPGVLGAPEDLVRLPDVLPPEAEAEGLEAHRLERAVAREDQQVGPGDLRAVLLLDRPQQPACLVEADVVRPAVQRGEPLRALAAAAPAVVDAVGAGGVPAHPDEQRPVVAVVGRPPVLRGRHHRDDVPLQRLDVEGRELLRVVEVRAHRVGPGRVLVQDAAGSAGSATSPGSSWAGAPWASGEGITGFSLSDTPRPSPDLVGLRSCVSVDRRARRCRVALGTSAPVDDLGLVDHEALVVGRRSGRVCCRRRSRRRRWRRTSGRRRGGGCRRRATS